MKFFPIEQGIVTKGGKVIPWVFVFAVLDEALDEKMRKVVRKKVSENIAYHSAGAVTEITDLAGLLGVKDGLNLHARVQKKIETLNRRVEDELGRFEIKGK